MNNFGHYILYSRQCISESDESATTTLIMRNHYQNCYTIMYATCRIRALLITLIKRCSVPPSKFRDVPQTFSVYCFILAGLLFMGVFFCFGVVRTMENCVPVSLRGEGKLTVPARRRCRLLAPSWYSSCNPPTTAPVDAGRRLAVHLGRRRLDKKTQKDNIAQFSSSSGLCWSDTGTYTQSCGVVV